MPVATHLDTFSETRHALGGDITLSLVASLNIDARQLLNDAWRTLLTFEKQCSRFLPSSELSLINKKAGTPWNITPTMFAILHEAFSMMRHTDELYSPFILPALERSGYDHSKDPSYTDDVVPQYAHRTSSSTDVTLSPTSVTLPFDTALDLGGIGKGYIGDLLGHIFRAAGVSGYWLNIDGDIATYGVTENNEPIAIDIAPCHPTLNPHSLPTIICSKTPMGVATSGTFERTTGKHAPTSHHIIDPRTGASAQTDILIATVCAPTAMLADVLASCAIIKGSRDAPHYLREKGALSWVIQSRQPDNTIAITTFGPHIKERP